MNPIAQPTLSNISKDLAFSNQLYLSWTEFQTALRVTILYMIQSHYHIRTKMNKPLKIVFFSSATIGIPFLEHLLEDEYFEIVWIVTQPDQPSWRWMELKPNTIKQRSQDNTKNIPITTPQTLRLHSKSFPWDGEKFLERIQNLQPDYIVVIAYGKIIPQHILDIPSNAPINIHWSLLPKYRGASPIQSSLLNGDAQTGITIMKMSAWLDEGDIISSLPIPLTITTNTQDLIRLFSTLWPDFVNQTLLKYSIGALGSTPQDNLQATFTKKIEKECGLIDVYSEPLRQILRKYNAYSLRPKVYFLHNNKRVIIENLQIDLEKYDQQKLSSIIDNQHNLNPAIVSLLVKPEWKKTMSREAWKSGYLK